MAEDKKGWLFQTNIWESITAFFTAGFEAVWGKLIDIFPKLVRQARNEVEDFLGGFETHLWLQMLNTFKHAGTLTDADVQNLLKMKDLGWPFDKLTYFWMMFTLLKDQMFLIGEPSQNLMRQELNKKHRSNLPHYSDVINAAFIAPEKTGEVKDILRRSGLKEEDINLIFLGRYRLYNEEDIRRLYLRGVLSEDEMFMRMRELGYTDTRTVELAQTWELIPPVQDIFHMVGKEAFEPDFIRLIGLDSEFPSDQLEWLRKQGISDDWARKYWYAHWDQPSLQMGFEMLHRNVIGMRELDLLFRAVEIPPFWRDKLTSIAYTPYTRVDVRRMHDMGILDDDQLLRSYMDLGYDEEKATNMALFTIKYNRQNDRELTRSQLTSSYAKSMISKSDAMELLKDLDYSEAQAEYMLMYEDWKRDLEYQEQLIENIGVKFKENIIDSFDTQKYLNELNLPAERTAILMDTWETQRFKNAKLPSKTDLDKFLVNGIIDKDTYYLQMKRLGYGQTVIHWYEQLLDKTK